MIAWAKYDDDKYIKCDMVTCGTVASQQGGFWFESQLYWGLSIGVCMLSLSLHWFSVDTPTSSGEVYWRLRVCGRWVGGALVPPLHLWNHSSTPGHHHHFVNMWRYYITFHLLLHVYNMPTVLYTVHNASEGSFTHTHWATYSVSVSHTHTHMHTQSTYLSLFRSLCFSLSPAF